MARDKYSSIFSRQNDAIVYCQERYLIGCLGSWLGVNEKRASEGKKIIFLSFAVPQSTESLELVNQCFFGEVSERTLNELRQGLHILKRSA